MNFDDKNDIEAQRFLSETLLNFHENLKHDNESCPFCDAHLRGLESTLMIPYKQFSFILCQECGYPLMTIAYRDATSDEEDDESDVISVEEVEDVSSQIQSPTFDGDLSRFLKMHKSI